MARVDYISVIPFEILTLIFTCLHAKSLGMCKCVSKSWNFLISDPHFIKAHVTRTPISKLLLLSSEHEHIANPESERAFYSVHFKNNRHDMVASKLNFDLSMYGKNKNIWSKVWGSCDGLILAEDNQKSMFLLNPTTLEFNMLPCLSTRYQSNKNIRSLFGFGYNSSCDDYAVIAICSKFNLSKGAFAYIYMRKTNKWKEVGFAPFDFTVNNDAAGILFRGSIYWLAKDIKESTWFIVAYNIANNEFSKLSLPNGICGSIFKILRLGMYEGCLCLVNKNVFETIAKLSVMEESGVMGSCIELNITVNGYSCFIPSEHNLVVMELYKHILLVYGAEEEARFYNYIKVAESPYKFEFGMTFVESLISPNNPGW